MEIKTGTQYQLIQEDMGSINEAVKRVRETPGGKVFAIIYLKLVLIVSLDNNILYVGGSEETFYEDIAEMIDESPTDVMFALSYLKELNLLKEA